MVKYLIIDAKGKDCIYKGFNGPTALKLWYNYREAGECFMNEFDFEDPEQEDENTWVFYEHDYLTCLYGADEEIKADMKMAIEEITGKEIEDFDLEYNDPGDTGNNATFWANNIKWKGGK